MFKSVITILIPIYFQNRLNSPSVDSPDWDLSRGGGPWGVEWLRGVEGGAEAAFPKSVLLIGEERHRNSRAFAWSLLKSEAAIPRPMGRPARADSFSFSTSVALPSWGLVESSTLSFSSLSAASPVSGSLGGCTSPTTKTQVKHLKITQKTTLWTFVKLQTFPIN